MDILNRSVCRKKDSAAFFPTCRLDIYNNGALNKSFRHKTIDINARFLVQKFTDHTIWNQKSEHHLGGEAMKKHPLWIFIIALVLFFLIAPSAQAFLFKDNVEKARDYIKANMVDSAVDLLKKEIEEAKQKLPESYQKLVEFYKRTDNGERELFF